MCIHFNWNITHIILFDFIVIADSNSFVGCEYPMDIAFVIDVKSRGTFLRAVNFLLAQVRHLALNSGLARVAVTISSDEMASHEVMLNSYVRNKPLTQFLTQLKKKDISLRHSNPGTLLEHIRKNVFVKKAGDR